jgi:hypothetical protein
MPPRGKQNDAQRRNDQHRAEAAIPPERVMLLCSPIMWSSFSSRMCESDRCTEAEVSGRFQCDPDLKHRWFGQLRRPRTPDETVAKPRWGHEVERSGSRLETPRTDRRDRAGARDRGRPGDGRGGRWIQSPGMTPGSSVRPDQATGVNVCPNLRSTPGNRSEDPARDQHESALEGCPRQVSFARKCPEIPARSDQSVVRRR